MAPLLFLFTILVSLLPTAITASRYPPCIQTCITNNTSYSWCRGDETARAQIDCLCRGLYSTPMIECLRSCDPGDQWEFVGSIPDTCRERWFPEAREANSPVNGTGHAERMGVGIPGSILVGAVVVAMGVVI